MDDLTVEDYSEKSIVVRGDTRPHKDKLKMLGGKWNPGLRDGGGWIFSKRFEVNVMEYISSGKITAPDWSLQKNTKHKTSPSNGNQQEEMRKLRKRVENLEKLLEDKLNKILDNEPEIEEESEEEMPRLLNKRLKLKTKAKKLK